MFEKNLPISAIERLGAWLVSYGGIPTLALEDPRKRNMLLYVQLTIGIIRTSGSGRIVVVVVLCFIVWGLTCFRNSKLVASAHANEDGCH